MAGLPLESNAAGAGRSAGQGGARAKIASATAALALLLAAFVGDVLTGEEVSFSFFYVVGVVVASWFLGRKAGLGAAALGVVAWIGAYLLVGKPYSQPSVVYWNVIVEGGIYVTVALAVARASAGLAKERELGAQLSRAYGVLSQEMSRAGKLQQKLLPHGPPEIDGYECLQHYATSARAGGDYYDFLPLSDGRVGIVVADASGHGVSAAVLMGMTLVLMHAASETALRPDRALDQVNRRLWGALPSGSFVTACYAILDPRNGHVEYSLAGHEPPMVQRATDGHVELLPLCGGPPLGLFSLFPEELSSTTLERGDILILYTDGLTEAENPQGEPFGKERLIESLKSGRTLPLGEIRTRVLAQIEAHTAGTALEDDLTLFLLRRSSDSSNPPRSQSLS